MNTIDIMLTNKIMYEKVCRKGVVKTEFHHSKGFSYFIKRDDSSVFYIEKK